MFALLLALIVFYFLHSLLAATSVKVLAKAMFGSVKWYRLFYSITSTLLLVVVIWILYRSPSTPLIEIPITGKVIGTILIFFGMVLVSLSIFRTGIAGFLGLEPENNSGLVRTGAHGYIRHPIYAGIIVAAMGWAMLTPTLPVLLSIAITFIYLPIGIHLEERKLIGQFGEEYIRYRNEVPALLPSIELKRSGKQAS